MESQTAAHDRRAEPPDAVKRVSEALREQGRTQVWLARKLELKRAALNNYLSGRRPFPIERLWAAYFILGLGAPQPPVSTPAAPKRRRRLTKARDSPHHAA